MRIVAACLVASMWVHAVGAAGAALHPVGADPNAGPRLSWRWKIDHVVERANLEERSGDVKLEARR
jgi:hypothetical protein